MFDAQLVRQQYSKRAAIYDLTMPFWKVWGLGEVWRKRAVRALNLRPGNTVLELGCGTGLNFRLLQEAVGSAGRIVAVDLTPEMLVQARSRVGRHGWSNVELIEADMTRFELPKGVDGILSTYAMSAIPSHDTVISRCAQALPGRGRLVILDVKRVDRIPLTLTPAWMLLSKPFEGSHRTSHQEPWKEMHRCLTDVQVQESRLGFVYLVSGARKVGMRNDRSW